MFLKFENFVFLEQDKSIDTLSTIIIKQKSLAQHIDSELNQHNGLR